MNDARTTRPPRGELASAVSIAVLKAGSRKVSDLAVELGVSEVSIRKTLDYLESKGVVRRFHGEAKAYDGDDIPFRMAIRFNEKWHIARIAAEHVEAGDAILIEAGSAAAFLAEQLKKKSIPLTVITPNLFIARIFRNSKVKVHVLGGNYQFESESLVGMPTIQALKSVGFSKAFLGVSGFKIGSGFSLNDQSRAEVSQAILGVGARNFILTDSSKFGLTQITSICSDMSLIYAVITDPGIPVEYRGFFEQNGVLVFN